MTASRLTADDLAGFSMLLGMQQDVSAASGPVTQARLLDFMDGLIHLPYEHYPRLSNAQLKGWIDTLYAALATTQTSYGCTMAGLYAAYAYYDFCKVWWQANPNGNDNYGRTGYPPDYDQGGGSEPGYGTDMNHGPYPAPWGAFAGLWKPPSISSDFFNAITSVMNLWGSVPPKTVIHTDDDGDYASLEQYGQGRFDPTNWTDTGNLATSLAGICTAQSNALSTLLVQGTPGDDAWLFILYLLAAQGASTSHDQQRAATIVNAPANSVEYPNDVLVNQLIYYVLMYWADPMGDFGWPNPRLQDEINRLSDAIHGQDPASQAILASLQRHGKILVSASSYPMVDPYVPSIGFSQRKTDTLFALGKAWASLKP